MRLADRAVARLRPREREYTVWDSLFVGLGVRVRPTGGKSWVLLEEAGARSRRVSLGPVSLKSAAEARREPCQWSAATMSGMIRNSRSAMKDAPCWSANAP